MTKTIFQKIKVPEDEFVEIVEKITKKLIYQFKFGYHTHQDIKQQAYIYAIEALQRYDKKRPLENFLWTHIRNRLFNYKRNNYKRPDPPCIGCPFHKTECADKDKDCNEFENKLDCDAFSTWHSRNTNKQKIMNFSSLDYNSNIEGKDASVDNQEIIDKIEASIVDSEIRSIYIKHKNNCKVSKNDFKKMINYIKSLEIL